MQDFSPTALWGITSELLGPVLWPLLALAVLIGVLLLQALYHQGGFRGRAARQALLVGLIGGIAAAALAPSLTGAQFGHLHGALDWLVLAAIGLGTFVGAALVAFALLGAMGPGRARRAAP